MRLTHLTLEQFRSYSRLEITFDSQNNVHLLLGPNAAGKTNILEAISLLSLTKSCQGADEVDLMQWGTEYYRVRANVFGDDGTEGTLEVASQLTPRKKKACFRNDVQVPVGGMVGSLPIVLFLPQDLSLFTGSPLHRRRFIDQLLCQVSPEYLVGLSRYQKILKQRNGLLKKIADGSAKSGDLSVWDEQLAERGAFVTVKRLELIEMLQCTLAEELTALGEQWKEVEIVYDRKGEKRDQADIQKELVGLLEHYRERDIILQSTSLGPHREDWHIDIDGRNLPTFASRGQQRTTVIALLFLQVSYLELSRGERPIVLLDDVFSELDDLHQSALLHCFADHQVIITTTHIPPELHGAQVWEVEEGQVSSRERVRLERTVRS